MYPILSGCRLKQKGERRATPHQQGRGNERLGLGRPIVDLDVVITLVVHSDSRRRLLSRRCGPIKVGSRWEVLAPRQIAWPATRYLTGLSAGQSQRLAGGVASWGGNARCLRADKTPEDLAHRRPKEAFRGWCRPSLIVYSCSALHDAARGPLAPWGASAAAGRGASVETQKISLL